VVGKRKIGEKIMFLGGPSLNKGVVAAFENVLGKGLIVPRHREVLGAYGAAISVQEKMMREGRKKSVFRGLRSAINDNMDYKEKICKADPKCHNQCKLKIYDFDGRKSIWGGECGRYEVVERASTKKTNYFKLREEVWMKHLEGVVEELGDEPIMEVDGRPTVGLQRALYGLHGAVLWAHFFDRLGFRLVMTPPTNTQISKAGIEVMTAETCFPVKVSHGHVKEMINKVSYMFLPAIVNMPTPSEEEAGFFCPLVQSNQYMVRRALDLDEYNIINPVIHLKYDPETLALELSDQICEPLKVKRSHVREAIKYALDRHNDFFKELIEKGKEIIDSHDPQEPLVVVTGRPYNLYDERLNLRLGRNLARIGLDAIPMDFIDSSKIDLSDFPSMYWGFGAQILRTAKFIRSIPWCYGIHVTNFSCGADSFIEHFYKYVMGDKPYLILELDEHTAVAGVMTRLEAYKNVMINNMHEQQLGEPSLRAAN
jgi:predicted nucleotide-binding protein (sugar kinase/HSP70/actin superfamily)